jgi:hypothetical protein
VTALQRAHLVVALGVINLCLVATGLAMSNTVSGGLSAPGQPSADGQAQAAVTAGIASPAGAIRASPRRPPGYSQSPSAEPSPSRGIAAELSSPVASQQASQREVSAKRTLSGHASGLVTVSRGRPVAIVTVTIRANEAVFVPQGQQSLFVHLQGAIRRPGPAGEFRTPVVAAIARLDSTPRQMSWSSRPKLDDRLESRCRASGVCVQSYRIVVALVDPAVRTATFAWAAGASAVIDRGTFQKNARVTVKATHRATIQRAAAALKSLSVQRVQLDADQRLVRDVTIGLPDGLDRAALAGVSLRAAVKANTAHGRPSGEVQIVVFLNGHRLTATRSGDVAPFLAFDPFASCRTAKPCRLSLRVEIRKLKADTASKVTIDWAVSAWAADPRRLARAPKLSVELGRSSEFTPKGPQRSKSR